LKCAIKKQGQMALPLIHPKVKVRGNSAYNDRSTGFPART
jgi:hypothetical protein